MQQQNHQYSKLSIDRIELNYQRSKADDEDPSFSELAELVCDTVYRTDKKGHIIFLNKKGHETFGYLPEEIKTQKLVPVDFLVFKDREKANYYLNEQLLSVKKKAVECTALTKNGDTFPIILKVRPVFQMDEMVGAVGVIVDLSIHKQMESQLRDGKEKYRDIFENMSDFWYIHDLNGNFIDTNFAFKKEFNLCENSLKNLNVRDLIHIRYRIQFDDYLQEVKDKGSFKGIMRTVLPNGDERFFEFKNSLVHNEFGVIGVKGTARDITARKKVEMALLKAEQRYRSVFENNGLPTVIIENDMTISKVNANFESFLGYSRDNIEGKMRLLDFMAQEDKERIAMNHSFKQQREILSSEYECQMVCGNGMVAEVLVRVGFIPKTRQTVASFTDMTSRNRAESALRETKEYLQKENIRLRSSIINRYRLGEIIGKSQSMQKVYEDILRAASTNVSVIIYGESGTGKELVARAIHDISDRCHNEFVTVNCGAIPDTILESEFFGYRKGAFTGADNNKPGFLDLANDGTLFLDEVGEINLKTQVKLLRVVDGGNYTPVGSNRIKKVNTRFISATNQNLIDLVKNGVMRNDFFYRIHILAIHLPPLRERKEDLPLLVDHFRKLFNSNLPPVHPNIMNELSNYEWPGNIRELQNVLHRYFTLKRLDFLDSPFETKSIGNDTNKIDINPYFSSDGILENRPLHEKQNAFEKDYILKILHQNRWHRGRTAEILGINRKTLFTKMKKHELIDP